MKRVLVTGGAGYIGSHTAKALAASGYEPIVIDNLSAGHRWAVQWGPLVVGDIADRQLITKTIERHQIEAVVHFAANAYVGESMELPHKYFQNNVSNSISLLNTVLDCGLRKLVFSSTCATYGIPQLQPIDEEHPQCPINPYGESKLFVERILSWYGKAYGLQSVCLRYFNAAGADPEGELGEVHDPETHLIPLTIRAAQGGYPPLKIFGTDYETRDGTAVRDYIHVCDLADAHVRALNYLHDGGESVSINLGTGVGYSVRDVKRAVELASGRTVPAMMLPRRSGDPAVLVARSERARTLLGWKPRFRELSDIVETAWQWHNAGTSAIAQVV